MAGTHPAISRRTALWRALVVTAVVVALDQVTKRLVIDSIAPTEAIHVMPGIRLVHWTNSGVAFSALAGSGNLVFVLSAAALTALIVFFARNPARPWLWLPTGMLLGGAIGNLIDRIRLGAVTDFVKLPLWPAFNVADMSITFGVIVLIFVIEAGRSGRD